MTGNESKLLNFRLAKSVLPAGRQQHALWLTQKCLENARRPPYVYLEAALENYSCPCPSPHQGLWMKHPSVPFNKVSTLMPFKAACRITDSCKCKTNLCTFLAWLSVPQNSESAPSPLRFISHHDLLLLLTFLPITSSQQQVSTYQPLFLTEISKSSQLVSLL